MDSTNNPGAPSSGIQLQGDATKAYAIRRIQRLQNAMGVQRKPTSPLPKPPTVKKVGY